MKQDKQKQSFSDFDFSDFFGSHSKWGVCNFCGTKLNKKKGDTFFAEGGICKNCEGPEQEPMKPSPPAWGDWE